MVGYFDIIPDNLMHPKRLKEFLEWLKNLEVDIWTKKYILIFWCTTLEVKLEEWMVDYVTGGKARLTRDKG